MDQMNSSQVTPSAASGLLSRFLGIILSPRQTFAGVVQRPKWLGMLLLLLVVSGGVNFAFMSTEVGQQAMLDAQVRQTESFGGQVTDQQYQTMEGMLPYMKYITLASTLFAAPIVMLAMAGILFGVFAALGGDANFRQVFSIVVHSSVISTLGQLFITPLNYVRESMTGATNLAVFFPMLQEGSFLARLFGMVDLFLVWWVIVLAIGLSVLYRRKTGPIAAALFTLYGLIAVGFAAFMSMRSGS